MMRNDLAFEYSANNHYKWGFGGEWHNAPNPNATYNVHFGYCQRPVLSFREECILAAKHIAERASKPIVVGLSGGFDSQMACLSFMEAGVDIKAVIGRYYVDGVQINKHDVKTAYEFCKRHNVEYIDFELSLSDFFTNEAPGLKYCAKYGFRKIEPMIQCATMDFVGQDYCYIMAGGDPEVSPMLANDVPLLNLPKLNTHIEGMTVAVWKQKPQPIMQHMIEMGYEGTSKFYLYTPELISAYLKHPAMQDFLLAQEPIYDAWCHYKYASPDQWRRCFHLTFKPVMVMKEWPEVIPIRKYTGFEKLYDTPILQQFIKNVKSVSSPMLDCQSVILTVPEFIDYLETPHTHSLKATTVVNKYTSKGQF